MGCTRASSVTVSASLYEEGPDVNRYSSFRFSEPVGAWGDELSSLYRFLMGRPGLVGELRLVQFIQGRQMRPDALWDLAGEKNEPVCSMCQMASVSLRATSTRATLGPRERPRRVLVRW
jgi:hypothetical protein